MSLPIELCYLHSPLSPALLKLGPNQKDPFGVLNSYKPASCTLVALHQQRLRRHFDRLPTLQPKNAVTPARKPKIVCNDERGKTIVAM